MLVLCALAASGAESRHSLSAGGRYHTENKVFTDMPFSNGDISYPAAYTFSDGHFALRLGVDFAPSASGSRDAPNTNRTDYVITPQASIILKDRIYRLGTGVLTSYVRDREGEGDWIDPYWQVMLGLDFPLGDFVSLELNAHYVIEKWAKLSHFRIKELEYGLWLSYHF